MLVSSNVKHTQKQYMYTGNLLYYYSIPKKNEVKFFYFFVWYMWYTSTTVAVASYSGMHSIIVVVHVC